MDAAVATDGCKENAAAGSKARHFKGGRTRTARVRDYAEALELRHLCNGRRKSLALRSSSEQRSPI